MTIKVKVIEAEVYTRVVGYYRPIQQFNNGKKHEAMNRAPSNVDFVELERGSLPENPRE